MRILRNIFRRKLRAFLTIFGIAIGVFALVVMGSIAEKLTLLVDGGVEYYQGKVVDRAQGRGRDARAPRACSRSTSSATSSGSTAWQRSRRRSRRG